MRILFAAVAGILALATGVKADHVYVSLSDGTIGKIAPDGSEVTYASGFQQPAGIAFDTEGNLFVAESSAGRISKVTPEGTISTFVSGLSRPDGLAFDASGNLYVSNKTAGTISKIAPDGTATTFASGFTAPRELTFDSAGNLYVSSFGRVGIGLPVSKITPAGTVTDISGIMGVTGGVSFDRSGNLYVGSHASILKITPDGQITTFATVITSPNPDDLSGLAFDGAGNLYTANDFRGNISKISPSGMSSSFWPSMSAPVPIYLAIRVPDPALVGVLLPCLLLRRRSPASRRRFT